MTVSANHIEMETRNRRPFHFSSASEGRRGPQRSTLETDAAQCVIGRSAAFIETIMAGSGFCVWSRWRFPVAISIPRWRNNIPRWRNNGSGACRHLCTIAYCASMYISAQCGCIDVTPIR